MDKKKRNRYIVYGVIIILAILAWLLFTTGGKKVATQLQSSALPIPAGLGVPAGGIAANGPIPIITGGKSCGCTVSLCDGQDNLQVKSAPDWTQALLSDSFGVNFTDGGVAFNYGGLTPTQVYGVYF